MTTGNSQRDNQLLPFMNPYFVYQQRMFHELVTTIKIETCAKDTHRRVDSLQQQSAILKVNNPRDSKWWLHLYTEVYW